MKVLDVEEMFQNFFTSSMPPMLREGLDEIDIEMMRVSYFAGLKDYVLIMNDVVENGGGSDDLEKAYSSMEAQIDKISEDKKRLYGNNN